MRPGAIVAFCGLLIAASAISNDSTLPVLPQIVADLAAGYASVQMTITIYILTAGLGQIEGAALTSLWTKVSGPGSVTFSNPASASTNVTFGEAGAYVLRLTVSDTELSGSDDVRVTLNGTNRPPTVSAGTDQAVAHPTTVTLAGAGHMMHWTQPERLAQAVVGFLAAVVP